MTNQVYLSIILPMYNEVGAIGEHLDKLLAWCDQTLAEQGYEVIVVDDGSSDNSANVVKGVNHPHLQLIQHPYNIGNGAAIKNGIRAATGKYALMMDSDGQHKVEDIPRLLEHIQEFHMVVGARTRESDTARHRNLANFIYNSLASYVCGRPIDDLTSGFRVLDAELAKSLVYLLPNTFSYPSTITLAVVRSGYSLKYVPIEVRKRIGKSKIKLLRDGSRFLTIILRIAVFFSPLKVFTPISVAFFLTGMVWWLYRVFILDFPFPPVSSLLMVTSVLIFLIGLISEQITYLRHAESKYE